jgi:short-subunit dehydrogenase
MGRSLHGMRVLVTGASTGIGADLARRLARGGAIVGLVARRAELLDEVLADCREHSPDSRAWAADLGAGDMATRIAVEAWEDLGHLDGLVNNAGMPMRRHVTDLTVEELTQVMDVNLQAPIRMTLALLPRMLARGGGTIVNVGSLAGRVGNVRESAYSASKFALTGFSEAAAADLYDTPVRIRLVQPGPIDTPIWDQPEQDPSPYDGPRFPPGQVSEAIIAALTGDAPFEQFVPGEFADIVKTKNDDVEAFIELSAAFGR